MKGKATIRISNSGGSLLNDKLADTLDSLMIITEQTRLDVLTVLEKKPSKSLWQKVKDTMRVKIL